MKKKRMKLWIIIAVALSLIALTTVIAYSKIHSKKTNEPAKVEEKQYDLILMDIMMPNMSGDQTLSKLKENPDFNTPVIAVTADVESGSERKYLNLGFTSYVGMPFTKEQIKDEKDKILSDEKNN